MYQLNAKADKADDLTENLNIISDNRIHGIILRLQTDMPLFPIEGLNRGGIFNESHNDIPVARIRTALHKNLIPAAGRR